jgi:uncharacterized membrane protein
MRMIIPNGPADVGETGSESPLPRYLVSEVRIYHRRLRQKACSAISPRMGATILSVLMLAGIALTAGGAYLISKKRDVQRGWLMIVAAVVVFGNVAIWALPF